MTWKIIGEGKHIIMYLLIKAEMKEYYVPAVSLPCPLSTNILWKVGNILWKGQYLYSKLAFPKNKYSNTKFYSDIHEIYIKKLLEEPVDTTQILKNHCGLIHISAQNLI